MELTPSTPSVIAFYSRNRSGARSSCCRDDEVPNHYLYSTATETGSKYRITPRKSAAAYSVKLSLDLPTCLGKIHCLPEGEAEGAGETPEKLPEEAAAVNRDEADEEELEKRYTQVMFAVDAWSLQRPTFWEEFVDRRDNDQIVCGSTLLFLFRENYLRIVLAFFFSVCPPMPVSHVMFFPPSSPTLSSLFVFLVILPA